MKISTRTRYGTRLMLGLALNYGKGPVLLRSIAKEEQISEKYLSQIIIPLKSNELVNSFRGAKGGYVLARAPSQITIREIVEVLEGGFNLVDCAKDTFLYARASVSVTHELWNTLEKKILETLDSVTLENLVKKYKDKDGKVFMYNI